MDGEVLVEVFFEAFFVSISQIEPGITFRGGILENFFLRSVDTLRKV